MSTRIELLEQMGVARLDAEQYIEDLEIELPKYGIADSRLRLAHFFSQVLHESGSMKSDSENLNYSAKALRTVFPKYFRTTKQAERHARQPEKVITVWWILSCLLKSR